MRIFSVLALATILSGIADSHAEDKTPVPEYRLAGKPLLYEPEIDRRRIHIAKIDSEYFEIGPYAGLLSVEDFGASVVTGVRGVMHATQILFLEGAHGSSAVSDTTYRTRNPNNPVFKSEFVPLTYTYVALGWNIMPGEVFLTKSLVMTSGVYLLGGLGQTEIDDNRWQTAVYGMGLRVLPIDWVSLHVDVRGFAFKSALFGRSKITHDIEMNLGASVYF